MKDYESLRHTKWECKYHIVFIPKYRRKEIFGVLCKDLGLLFRELARHKEGRVEEEHLMEDHVHMLLSIPPKYSVSQMVGYKSAMHIARTHMWKQLFTGENSGGCRQLADL